MKKAYSYSRFSDPRQAKGDSLDRQLSAAREYAAEHGLELDTSLRPDEGLSGYTGKNRSKGSLGDFLKMVEGGRVAKGSFLLVDSMDRLSRLRQTEAAHQLLSLALAGVRVVTINDRMVFDEDADLPVMINAVLKIQGAHDYSKELARKVARGHASAKRKAREEGRIYSRNGPSWLRLNDARTEWIRVPERVALVQSIFDMADGDGMGSRVIGHHLTADRTAPFRHGERWHQMTVLKLLKNRSVLGEYQPRFRNGDPDGETIQGYYRTAEGVGIIEPAQFHRVNLKLAMTGATRGRRTGPNEVRDLLQSLGKCGLCGGTAGVHVRSKDKRHLYYCNEAGVKGCANRVRYRRDEIEKTLLRVVSEVDLSEPRQRTAETSELDAAVAERAGLAAKVERLLDLMEDGDATVRERHRQRVAELRAKDEQIAKLRTTADQMRALHAPSKHQDTVREFAATLSTLNGRELYQARSRLSAALKNVIDYVTFDPAGYVDIILCGGLKVYRIGREGELIGGRQVLPFKNLDRQGFTHGDPKRDKLFEKIRP